VLQVLDIKYEDLFQDFDAKYIRETIEKYKTNADDIRVVLTANPDLSPAEIEVIMRIVESKEKELRKAERDKKYG